MAAEPYTPFQSLQDQDITSSPDNALCTADISSTADSDEDDDDDRPHFREIQEDVLGRRAVMLRHWDKYVSNIPH